MHPDLLKQTECKNEFHKKLDELNYQLFQHTMQRKNEATQELEQITNSDWLNQECQTIANIILLFIQAELNRCLMQTQFVKDYFALKRGKLQKSSDNDVQPIEIIKTLTEESNSDQSKQKSKKQAKTDPSEDKDTTAKIIAKIRSSLDYCTQKASDIICMTSNTNTNDKNDKSSKDKKSKTEESVSQEIDELKFKDEEEQLLQAQFFLLQQRLLRIIGVGEQYINDVCQRHEQLMKKLDEWVHARIQCENEAIDELVEHVRTSIENEEHLYFQLQLVGENFLIDKDVVMHPMPDPIQPLQTKTNALSDSVFTIMQMLNITDMIQMHSNTSFIKLCDIETIFQKLQKTNYAHTPPVLPQKWAKMPFEKLEHSLLVYRVPIIDNSQSNQMINWKLFMISNLLNTYSFLTNVNTLPSLDTLMELNEFFQVQTQTYEHKNHILLQQDFDKVQFWFHRDDVETDTCFKQLLYSYVHCICNTTQIYIDCLNLKHYKLI